VPLVMSLKQTKLISSWEEGVIVVFTPTIATSPLFKTVCESTNCQHKNKETNASILFIIITIN